MTTPQSSERVVENVVEYIFIEHIEDLISEAEMAVRYEVRDKEQYYERLRTGSRELVDAIRTTLHQELQKARADWLRSEIEKFETLTQSLEDELKWMDCSPSDNSVIQKHIEELRSTITRHKEELKVLESK